MKKILICLLFLFLAGSLLPVNGAFAFIGKPVVVLNPGHGTATNSGKIDPGAVSGSLLEKDINLEVAQKTKALLNNCPLDVYLTRNGDDSVNQLTGLQKIVNDLNPSIGIAIHTNSVASGSPSGTEAWSTVGGNNDSESKRLGGILASQISSVLGINNYGVKLETSNRYGGLYIHYWKAPAALVELGYLQGDKDALVNRRADFANAIATGILQYFSISKDCLSSGNSSSPQPTFSPQVDDPVGKMFAYGQCTYYAAKSRDDLFMVINQSSEIQAMGWAAARWDDNFRKLYNDHKSSYIVDDISEINAVMVWDPGVGSADATNGHVGIVEKVVDDKTVIVRDANWGGTPDVKTRTVSLISGMHFIHTISYKRDTGQDNQGNFVGREVSGSFSVINPLRKIYVKSSSEFVLTLDGKEVLSSARPQSQAIFSTTQWLSPGKDHSYLIKYQELQNIDSRPELIQTWWPNSLVQAGEPDPPLQVNYSYVLSPQSARVGDQVQITIGANIPSVNGLIEGINIYIDGRLLSSINGQNGTYVWDTRDFSVDLHQIEFEARVNGFSGPVKKASTGFQLTANGNGPNSAPVNKDASACTESSIRSYLESKGSPLKDYTSDLIAAGELYNVDPRFIVSISNAESSFGAHLCASFNAWGIMSSGSCRAFSSWSEGITYVTRLVGYNYLPKGQNNIPSFVKMTSTNGGTCTQHCYCASGCDNWINNVGSAYQQMGGDQGTEDLTFQSCSTSLVQPPSDNHPPKAPILVSPDDWAVTQDPSIQLCAKENGDPDAGDRVTEYDFQIFDSAQNWESGWTSAGCVTPTGLRAYNYKWHLKVRDTHGTESSWSDVRHFGITGNSVGSMEKPVLMTPSNNLQLPADRPVELIWNISSQAQKYKVEVWGGPYNLMTPCDWQSTTICRMGTMWPGTMSWHVKAKDASGKETEWSDTWSFTITNNQNPIPVEVPKLSYPQNNAVFTDADEIQLRWDGMANASAYTVELWGGPYDRMVPCDLTSETKCNIGRIYPGVMSWRVLAKRSDNQLSDWSEIWNFEVQQKSNPPTKPEKPILSEPANNGEVALETDITLVWNASQGYDYKVELWGDAYDQKMTPCDWSNAVSCHIGTMWPGLASWHVIARDQNGAESDWSDTWNFRVREVNIPVAVEIPNLVNPTQNSSLQENEEVVLRWNSSANATEYQVELWGGPYSTMTPCNWVMDLSCYIGQMWPGAMQWHVRARDGQGKESPWSETWTFNVNEIAVVPTEPPPPPTEPPPATEPPAEKPGFVELADNLELRSDGSGSWPPLAGDKLIAHIKVRNGGDESIHVANIGVRGRRNGSDFWDIGFWSIDLGGNSEWNLDPNNERPLEPGNYSFRISYTLDGSNWIEIGNEINFTVQ